MTDVQDSQLEGAFSEWQTIRPARSPFPCLRCSALKAIRQIVREGFPLPPLAGVSEMDLRLLYVQYLAHDDHQNLNFLFRLR
jgi:hypothetical protein